MAKVKTETVRTRFATLRVADVVPTPDNCRVFDPKDPQFLDLVEDVRVNGVQVPVQVRPHPKQSGKWDLRCGERRVRAAQAAGREIVPAIVYDGMSDDSATRTTFKENFNRADLKPVEEARAIQKLLGVYHNDASAVASFCGRTERWVRMRERLLKLIPEWWKAAEDPKHDVSLWSAAHLELIARFDEQTQKRMFKENVWHQTGHRGVVVSVATLDAWLRNTMLRALKSATFDPADATLVKAAPACDRCGKRSSCQGLLFAGDHGDGVTADDQCLDADCWMRKTAAALLAQHRTLAKEHPGLRIVLPNHMEWDEREQWRKAVHQVEEIEYGEAVVPMPKDPSKTSAKPALMAAGPDAGKVVWIGKARDARQPSSRSGARQTTPLKERRQGLESKRWCEVIKQLGEAVKKVQITDLDPTRLIALASVFGTLENNDNPFCFHSVDGESCQGSHTDSWTLLHSVQAAGHAACLWRSVRGVLISRLDYSGPVTQLRTDRINDAQAMAAEFGIDLKPMISEAERVYPEPKGWQTLNADGTPKKEAAKASRKARRKGVAGSTLAKRQRKSKKAKKVEEDSGSGPGDMTEDDEE